MKTAYGKNNIACKHEIDLYRYNKRIPISPMSVCVSIPTSVCVHVVVFRAKYRYGTRERIRKVH